MGYEVFVSVWYGLQGAPQKWPIRRRDDPSQVAGVVTILPHCGAHIYGADTIGPYYRATKADVLITNMDVWVLPAEETSQTRFCPWLPVDHDPLPQPMLDALRPAVYAMCYSEWGTQILKDNGIDAHHVPCSADSTVFHPVDRAEARAKLGVPKDGFIVAMVSANKDPSDRKGFGEALAGFAKVAEAHGDAYLYVHTNWNGPIQIATLGKRLGIADRLIRPDALAYLSGGYREDYLNYVYNAADVLLNPAKSEGFGLPIIEAQMAGCPVAASDFSTSHELVKAGWLIGGQKHWSIGADSFRLLVSIDSVAAALEEAYAARGNEVLRAQARKGALAYDTLTVAEQFWRPALADIDQLVNARGGELKMVTF
jgi:glycosyltransferase involved in cell wall biosynthesis